MKNSSATEEARLHHALQEYFGFSSFRPGQLEAIRWILRGRDVFILMPTGGGKSLCYQLPALVRPGLVIVVSPLIALMRNQVELLRSFGFKKEIAHFLNSQLSRKQASQVKESVRAGKTRLLYLAPETLMKEDTLEFLQEVPELQMIVVDEAHCISEWGHDFRPEYRQIRHAVDVLNPSLQIVAVTATATPRVREDIIHSLGMRNPVEVVLSFNRPNLFYDIRRRPPTRTLFFQEIAGWIQEQGSVSGIVYCLYRKTTEDLARYLRSQGISAEAYHAGLSSRVRNQRQEAFLSGHTSVMVATIAFGLGIDKPDIRYVIHADFPRNLEAYYQETGRAGRDGKPSYCLAFVDNTTIPRLEQFLRDRPAFQRELGRLFLEDVRIFINSGFCRRKFLLHYLGETFPEDHCNNCDNCQMDLPAHDVTEEILLLLRVIQQISDERLRFPPAHLIHILRGEQDYRVQVYGHYRLPEYGKGKAHDPLWWEMVIYQAWLEGLVERDLVREGSLVLTDRGRLYLESPYLIRMPVPRPLTQISGSHPEKWFRYRENTREARISRLLDEHLLRQLEKVREDLARKSQKLPTDILPDPALQQMALHLPVSREEMLRVTGMSEQAYESFGKHFLEVLLAYVRQGDRGYPRESGELIRRESRETRQWKVRGRMWLREEIQRLRQCLQRGMALDHIALQFGISTVEELLHQINGLMDHGFTFSLDSYLEEELEDQDVEDVRQYLQGHRDATLEDVVEALKSPVLPERIICLSWLKLRMERSLRSSHSRN